MKSNPIKRVTPPEKSDYITWDDDPKSIGVAMSKAAGAYQNSLIHSAKASTGRQYDNYLPNVSVRDGFTNADYEFFRDREAIPQHGHRRIVGACMGAYESVGIVKNIIDLMADFASRGIRIVHKDKKKEEWYQNWWKKVRGQDRSERFLNMFYRAGNVIIQRETAKLKPKDKKNIQRGKAKPDVKPDKPPKINGPEIPYSYYIHDPCWVEVIRPEIARYSRKKFYGLRLPNPVAEYLSAKNPGLTDIEKEMIAEIPGYIRNAKLERGMLIVLPPDKTSVYHYKKDDAQLWALPMTYPILEDIRLLKKLKLTDIAACDDAIKRVRIWNLGSLDHKIVPNDGIVSYLNNLIMQAGEGAIDIVWGPDLKLNQSNSDVAKHLGSEKYEACLSAIYQGYGIPSSLAGHGESAGMTNNFVSIKTLIERLNYGRDKLLEFWRQEVRLVQLAMGHDDPPEFMFDIMNLTDEVGLIKLLIDLVDRDILSADSVLEQFGRIPEIEEMRIRRSLPERKEIPKVGPYYTPVDSQPELTKEKMFIQGGTVTPSEVSVNLSEKDPSQKTPLDLKQQKINSKTKSKGKPGEGRPVNSTDTKQRKQRIPKACEMETLLWARHAYSEIGEVIQPLFLEKLGKANLRQLNDSEAKSLEDLRFGVLSNIDPGDKINTEQVYAAMSIPFSGYSLINRIFKDLVNNMTRTLTLDDERELRCVAYTLYWSNK